MKDEGHIRTEQGGCLSAGGVWKAGRQGAQGWVREKSTEQLDGPWWLLVWGAQEEGLCALPSPDPRGPGTNVSASPPPSRTLEPKSIARGGSGPNGP